IIATELVAAGTLEMSPGRATDVRRSLYDEAYYCMLAWEEPVSSKGLTFTARLSLNADGLVDHVTLQPAHAMREGTRECLIKELYQWSFAELTAGKPRVVKFTWRISAEDYADVVARSRLGIHVIH